jgi:hypothetical protein
VRKQCYTHQIVEQEHDDVRLDGGRHACGDCGSADFLRSRLKNHGESTNTMMGKVCVGGGKEGERREREKRAREEREKEKDARRTCL